MMINDGWWCALCFRRRHYSALVSRGAPGGQDWVRDSVNNLTFSFASSVIPVYLVKHEIFVKLCYLTFSRKYVFVTRSSHYSFDGV